MKSRIGRALPSRRTAAATSCAIVAISRPCGCTRLRRWAELNRLRFWRFLRSFTSLELSCTIQFVQRLISSIYSQVGICVQSLCSLESLRVQLLRCLACKPVQRAITRSIDVSRHEHFAVKRRSILRRVFGQRSAARGWYLF